jgi:hypothetical protein
MKCTRRLQTRTETCLFTWQLNLEVSNGVRATTVAPHQHYISTPAKPSQHHGSTTAAEILQHSSITTAAPHQHYISTPAVSITAAPQQEKYCTASQYSHTAAAAYQRLTSISTAAANLPQHRSITRCGSAKRLSICRIARPDIAPKLLRNQCEIDAKTMRNRFEVTPQSLRSRCAIVV